eukprot:TRINITY_DN64196_c0_g1_i1.p1 TRINITY_DN64196_c0_g1~~TRINITY_DN64196_c0_g1_i1.p1  ORF type:complete len:746 (+),score=100.19 TRINITY_DN64196_c0_g1_i1:506-2743(+)
MGVTRSPTVVSCYMMKYAHPDWGLKRTWEYISHLRDGKCHQRQYRAQLVAFSTALPGNHIPSPDDDHTTSAPLASPQITLNKPSDNLNLLHRRRRKGAGPPSLSLGNGTTTTTTPKLANTPKRTEKPVLINPLQTNNSSTEDKQAKNEINTKQGQQGKGTNKIQIQQLSTSTSTSSTNSSCKYTQQPTTTTTTITTITEKDNGSSAMDGVSPPPSTRNANAQQHIKRNGGALLALSKQLPTNATHTPMPMQTHHQDGTPVPTTTTTNTVSLSLQHCSDSQASNSTSLSQFHSQQSGTENQTLPFNLLADHSENDSSPHSQSPGGCVHSRDDDHHHSPNATTVPFGSSQNPNNNNQHRINQSTAANLSLVAQHQRTTNNNHHQVVGFPPNNNNSNHSPSSCLPSSSSSSSCSVVVVGEEEDCGLAPPALGSSRGPSSSQAMMYDFDFDEQQQQPTLTSVNPSQDGSSQLQCGPSSSSSSPSDDDDELPTPASYCSTHEAAPFGVAVPSASVIEHSATIVGSGSGIMSDDDKWAVSPPTIGSRNHNSSSRHTFVNNIENFVVDQTSTNDDIQLHHTPPVQEYSANTTMVEAASSSLSPTTSSVNGKRDENGDISSTPMPPPTTATTTATSLGLVLEEPPALRRRNNRPLKIQFPPSEETQFDSTPTDKGDLELERMDTNSDSHSNNTTVVVNRMDLSAHQQPEASKNPNLKNISDPPRGLPVDNTTMYLALTDVEMEQEMEPAWPSG